MAFACNIDRRGRLARLIYGVVVLGLGVVLVVTWAAESGSVLRWVVCVAVMVAGAFAVFESVVGWCAMRAMGFKTPM